MAKTHRFHTKTGKIEHISLPEYSQVISNPGQPQRYRNHQSRSIKVDPVTGFKTTNDVLAERIRQDGTFGSVIFEGPPPTPTTAEQRATEQALEVQREREAAHAEAVSANDALTSENEALRARLAELEAAQGAKRPEADRLTGAPNERPAKELLGGKEPSPTESDDKSLLSKGTAADDAGSGATGVATDGNPGEGDGPPKDYPDVTTTQEAAAALVNDHSADAEALKDKAGRLSWPKVESVAGDLGVSFPQLG